MLVNPVSPAFGSTCRRRKRALNHNSIKTIPQRYGDLIQGRVKSEIYKNQLFSWTQVRDAAIAQAKLRKNAGYSNVPPGHILNLPVFEEINELRRYCRIKRVKPVIYSQINNAHEDLKQIIGFDNYIKAQPADTQFDHVHLHTMITTFELQMKSAHHWGGLTQTTRDDWTDKAQAIVRNNRESAARLAYRPLVVLENYRQPLDF